MPCVFCTDPSQSGTVVYEDEVAWVVLHDDWSPRGHAMVVARRHVENASDLDERELARFTSVWQRAERAILETAGAPRAMLLKLGIATPHLHLHIYPAAASDDRAEVFAMFDGERGVARDETFIAEVRKRMND